MGVARALVRVDKYVYMAQRLTTPPPFQVEGFLGEAPGAGFLRMSQAGAPVWNSSPDSPEMEQGGL